MRISKDVNDAGAPTGMPFLRDEEHAPTMPLGTGSEFGDALDPLAGAEARRGINTGAIVLGVVVLVAAGGLFSLRKLSHLTAASLGDQDIESRVEEFLKRTGGDGPVLVRMSDEGILGVIKDDFEQVSPENVRKDPFVIAAIDLKDEPAPSAPKRSDKPAVDPVKVRYAELRKAAEGFQVKSVLGGQSPMAVLDNVTVRENGRDASKSVIVHEGDVVLGKGGVEFLVESIAGGVVTVVAEDPALELRVSVPLTVSRDQGR